MTNRYSVGGLMKDQVFDGSELLAQCLGSEDAHWLVDKLNRAEAAEARVAELERIHSEVMLQGEAATIRRLQSKLARAERLAEAAGRHSHCWDATTHRQLREALAAFRSPEPQEGEE